MKATIQQLRHEVLRHRKSGVFLMACGVLWLATTGTLLAEQDPPDPFAGLRFLVGAWEGKIGGKLGTGTGQREYQFVIQGRYLWSRHKSARPPQEKSPRGGGHEEWGMFSYDRARRKIVYRQFVEDGFVNRYTCEFERSPRRFVCITEDVESGPGMRARWTVTAASDDQFEEIFELAEPGADFVVFFTNTWRRIK